MIRRILPVADFTRFYRRLTYPLSRCYLSRVSCEILFVARPDYRVDLKSPVAVGAVLPLLLQQSRFVWNLIIKSGVKFRELLAEFACLSLSCHSP